MNFAVRSSRIFAGRAVQHGLRQTKPTVPFQSRSLSSVAYMPQEDLSFGDERHCPSCTCSQEDSTRETMVPKDTTQTASDNAQHACGYYVHDNEELPPPLPEPTYSVHKRVMPENLIALSSSEGRKMLLDALHSHTAESYWSLMEHFSNQSDPAYCGITTLLIVLNSMSVDPNIRWRGGWRYYGDEDTLLQRCCFSRERIKRVGISMEEFARLAKCQGLQVEMKHPTDIHSVDDFRENVVQVLSNQQNGILVTSFARSALGQTGEGHFSPIAAYHKESDCVLVLDVARFKYAPYWVSISELYEAMKPLDETSQKPRGWFVMHPPPVTIRTQANLSTTGEARRPAHLVPEAKESDICPIGKVKVHYCEARHDKETE